MFVISTATQNSANKIMKLRLSEILDIFFNLTLMKWKEKNKL